MGAPGGKEKVKFLVKFYGSKLVKIHHPNPASNFRVSPRCFVLAVWALSLILIRLKI